MAALSPSFALALALNSRVHSVPLGAPFSSPLLVRLHGSCRRHRTASCLTPRCEAAFNEDYFTFLSSSWFNPDNDQYRRDRCNIVAISLCGPSTPLETREKLAIVESELPQALEELCQLEHIEEAAVLSTCTRMEIYALAEFQDRGVSQVTDWISKSHGVPVSEICKHRVLLFNRDAVKHLFQVSAGLELGESEITPQLFKAGRHGRGFAWMVSMLFARAMGVGKWVRREASIDAGAVSLSSAAMNLVGSSSLGMARVLVVGAGVMGNQVIKHLVARGCKKVVVVSRCEVSVAAIRIHMGMEAGVEIIYKPLSEMYDCAAQADVVFTATSTGKPLFLKQHVEKLPPAQQLVGGVRLFIDFCLPRNVASCVASLGTACCRVYNLDDLKQVAEAAAAAAAAANKDLTKAQAIIDVETGKFEDLKDVFGMAPTVEAQKAMLERVRVAWLEKRLSQGGIATQAQRKAIEDYSWDRINKRLKNALDMLTPNNFRMGSAGEIGGNPDPDQLYSAALSKVEASMGELCVVDSVLKLIICTGAISRDKTDLEICNEVLDRIVFYSEEHSRVLKMAISELETLMAVSPPSSSECVPELSHSKHEIKVAVASLETAVNSLTTWKEQAQVCRPEIPTDLNHMCRRHRFLKESSLSYRQRTTLSSYGPSLVRK